MDKIVFKNEFVAIVERERYSFLRQLKAQGTVAIVPFRATEGKREYLARVEICPAHSLEKEQNCITGSIRSGEDALACAQRELFEEAGYKVEKTAFINLGTVYPSKMMDTIAYLFAVDVTGYNQESPTGDGSFWEQGAGVVWLSEEDSLNVKDALFLATLQRFEKQVIRR